MNPFANKFLVGATITIVFLQMLAIYNPLMQRVLRTTELAALDWLLIVPIAASIVLVEEVRKFVYRRNLLFVSRIPRRRAAGMNGATNNKPST